MLSDKSATMLDHDSAEGEIQRIAKIYNERSYDNDPNYSDSNEVYLHRSQSLERSTLRALRNADLADRIGNIKVLDFGCGTGKWFLKWIAWGALPGNLTGVDIRPDVIEKAQTFLPNCKFKVSKPTKMPFPDNFFDIVVQNVVFTSILSSKVRKEAALELLRVLKPNGIILWYDFIYNNPSNPNVRKVGIRELKTLFQGCQVYIQRITLAPLIARRIVPISWSLASVLESLKILNTHVLALISRNKLPVTNLD